MNQEEREKRKEEFFTHLNDRIKKNFLKVDKITVINTSEPFQTHEEKELVNNGYISIDEGGLSIISVDNENPFDLSICPSYKDEHEIEIVIKSTFKKSKNEDDK